MRHDNPRRAFTLVELLVVIAIISILAGLLLPVLSNALAAARGAACVSRQKQMHLSLSMYVDDFNGLIPPPYNSADPPGGYFQWLDRLERAGYIDINWKAMQTCPSGRDPIDQIVFNGHMFDLAVNGSRNSGAPYQYSTSYGNGTYYQTKRTLRPSQLYLFVESTSYWYSASCWLLTFPHKDVINVAHHDGHVQSFQFGNLPGLTWSGKLPWFNQETHNPNAGYVTSRLDE